MGCSRFSLSGSGSFSPSDSSGSAASVKLKIDSNCLMHGICKIKQCCGSGMFVPDPWSDFFPSRIPNPNCIHPGSGAFLTPGSGIRNRFEVKSWILGARVRDVVAAHGSASRSVSNKYGTDPNADMATEHWPPGSFTLLIKDCWWVRNTSGAVLRIRITFRIHRIHMFLELPDQDSLVWGTGSGSGSCSGSGSFYH
jgi:hypothetical protein